MLLNATVTRADDPVKIGFLVKQPERSWLQDEWRFTEIAAKAKAFTLVKIGVPSDGTFRSAIDHLAAKKVWAFVIYTSDVKLGPDIVAKLKADGLKLMALDDRLVDASVGDGLAAEIKKRGWEGRRRHRRNQRTAADRA